MRRFASATAVALGVLALLGLAAAQGSQSSNITADENDGRALNYMLAIANLQTAIFTVGLQNTTAQDFVNAGYNESVYTSLMQMQEEHMLETDWMKAELVMLNTTAVAPCTYNFSSFLTVTLSNTSTVVVGNETTVNSTITIQVMPTAFLEAALLVHNLTLEAYIGVINTISNAGIVQTVASIIAVEARHASYLSTVLGMDPFPNAFEPSMPPSNVTAKPLPFTEECPFETLPLPVDRDIVTGCSTSNSTTPTTNPSSQPTSSVTPTNATNPTTAPQSAASAVTASSALVVTVVAAIVAAAIHAVSL